MVEKENTFDDYNNIVILCRKCYEKKVYTIVICKINKEINNPEYQCSKCNILEEKDILKVDLDENLKNILNNCRCKEHQNNTFCAWCEESKENLCPFCIAEKLKKNQQYILYIDYLDKIKPKNLYYNQIQKLENILKNYNKYIPNHKKDVNLISKLNFHAHLAFNNYFKEEIFNYQSIKNVSLNLENLEKDNALLETILYKNFIGDILNKDESQISIKIFKLPFPKCYTKLIPLKNEFNDNNDCKKMLKKSKYFALYILDTNSLYIYDINGNIINVIEFKTLKINNKIEIIQYENDILLLFSEKKFIFIFFSKNFQKYEILEYNPIINIRLLPNIIDFLNYGLNSKLKLIKFDKKNVFLLYEYNTFIINFYEQEKNIQELNSNFNDEFVFDMISIYYKHDKNKINKELVCASPKLIITNDIHGFQTILDFFKEIKIIIYGNDLKPKDWFIINNRNILFPIEKTFFDLNYNYSNNALLLLVKDNILQISLKTKEITTIYQIEPYNYFKNNETNIIQMCDGPFRFFSFHNYNEKTKDWEEIVYLQINLKNKIYLYYWNDSTLLLKENFEKIYLNDLTELNTFNNNRNGEKILIHEDNLIIYLNK